MKNASLKFKARDLLTNSDVSKKKAIRVWIENEWKNMHIFGILRFFLFLFFLKINLEKGRKKMKIKIKVRIFTKTCNGYPSPSFKN